MQTKTETLEIGSKVPEFTLSAANQEGEFSLRDLIEQGPLVIEFMRGTW